MWHVSMGISKLLLYTHVLPGSLLQEPLIIELMKKGGMEIVLFNELPIHEHGYLAPSHFDTYGLQVRFIAR